MSFLYTEAYLPTNKTYIQQLKHSRHVCNNNLSNKYYTTYLLNKISITEIPYERKSTKGLLAFNHRVAS